MEEYFSETDNSRSPPFVKEAVTAAAIGLLPEKSKWSERNTLCYRSFMEYRAKKNIDSFSETILLGYFAHLSISIKTSSMWAFYLALKSTLLIHHDIDLCRYTELTTYLKQQGVGLKPHKLPEEPLSILKISNIQKSITECDCTSMTKTQATNLAVAWVCQLMHLEQDQLSPTTAAISKVLNKAKLRTSHRKSCSDNLKARCSHVDLDFPAFSSSVQKEHCQEFVAVSNWPIKVEPPDDLNINAELIKNCAQSLELKVDIEPTLVTISQSLERQGNNVTEGQQVAASSMLSANSSMSADCSIKDEPLEDMEMSDDESASESSKNHGLYVDVNLDEGASSVPLSKEALEPEEDTDASSLSAKSKPRYEHIYKKFCEWKSSRSVENLSENLILNYLSERSLLINAASLWSEYSMLKSMIKMKEEIDISQWKKIAVFLKQNSKGYKAKKSNALQRHHCIQFLKEAPDEVYLMNKVALILGIHGACRSTELTAMKIDNIKIKDDCLVVTLPDVKNSMKRSFAITNELIEGVNMIEIFKKYYDLRPPHTTHQRLFVFYNNGKCSTNPVGKNTFSIIPSKIAKYLKLENPELYTGHCFRRSSLMAKKNARLLHGIK